MTHSHRRSMAAATLAVLLSTTCLAHAADLNAGSVTATDTSAATSDNAIGAKAPKGTAANVAPSQAPLSATQPIAVISRKVIQNTVPVTSDFASTIATAPSVVVNSPNGMGNGEATGIQLRGFSDGQFSITMDGIPFGDSNDFTHHTTAYFPSDILDSVDVDRGPGYASTVGEATFGGTVAMHSLQTEDHFGGTVTGAYGSWNTQHYGMQLQSGILNDSGTKMAVSAERNSSDGAMVLAHDANTNFTAKITQPIADRFVLTAFSSLQWSKYNNNNQISLTQEQLYGKNYAALSNNPLSQQWVGANRTAKSTDFEYLELAGDAALFQIDNKLYTFAYDNHEKDSNNANQLTTPDSIAAGQGAANGEDDALGYTKLNRYRSVGDILTLSRDIDAGVASGTFKVGAWVEHQNNDRNVEWMDFNTGMTYLKKLKNHTTTPLAAYKYALNSRIDTQQPYVEYDWKPVNGLTITPGFKYVSFTRVQDGPINQTTQLPVNERAPYHASLPYLSINYRITPNLSAYAQYAEGFLAPNVNLLYTVGSFLNRAQPQKTTNYQIGGVYRSGRLTADADFYYINFNNYISSITPPGGTFSYFINSGAVQYKGVEGEATYVVGHGFSLFGAGSMNSAHLGGAAASGETAGLPMAPHWIADFGPMYDDGTYFGSFLTKYVGPTADASGTWWVKTYDTSNLVGGVHLGSLAPRLKDVKVTLGVYNIFNHRNILDETADVQNGVLQSDTTVDYLAPLSVAASVSVQF